MKTLEENKDLKSQIGVLEQQVNQMRNEQDEFIQIASHDLQAPLRKLSSFTDLLLSKFPLAANEEILHYKTKIDSCISQMRELLDKLTTLSEVTSSRVEFQPCDLNLVLKKVLNEMAEGIKINNVAITTSELPIIEGISNQFYELFKNLLQNAILYRKKDQSANICIQSRQIENEEQFLLKYSPNTYYQIEIIDNGIGIDEELLGKVFQPFVRLHGKSEYPGHGLGLTICKRIVENHKGILTVESNNNGSRFIIFLPK